MDNTNIMQALFGYLTQQGMTPLQASGLLSDQDKLQQLLGGLQGGQGMDMLKQLPSVGLLSKAAPFTAFGKLGGLDAGLVGKLFG